MKYIVLIILSSVVTYLALFFALINNLENSRDLLIFFIYYFFITVSSAVYYKSSLASNFKARIYALINQFIFILFSLSIVITLTDVQNIPRQFLLSITVVFISFNWFISSYLKNTVSDKNTEEESQTRVAPSRLFISLVALTLAFLTVLYYKTNGLIYYIWLEQIILYLTILWFISGVITRKFHEDYYSNLYYKIAPIIKSQIIFLLFSAGIFYFFQLDYFSRELLFGTILLYSIVETSLFSFIFIKNKTSNKNKNLAKVISKVEASIQEDFDLSSNYITSLSSNKTAFKKLAVLKNKALIEWILKTVKQSPALIDEDAVIILSTAQANNFRFLNNDDRNKNLVVNLTHVNNFQSINEMFLATRLVMNPGGILIGSFSPLEEDYNKMFSQMPKFLFTFIYPIHFIFFRIFPKLPILGVIYEFITKGKGRFISKAEVLGRLSYCGFKVIGIQKQGHNLFFAGQYSRTKSQEKNPSLGPIVKLKRIGYDKGIIEIYKFRTMHPYSEFIQSDIFEQQDIDSNGKIKDDFRITSWGRILRKLWIDEIPQIYNWVRGDISIVGVRALSNHYFSLYPKDMQNLRVKLKPGLIPPYYADMPKNFEEIIDSEKNYIVKKLESAFKTDLYYFYQAFINIIFRGARSQ